MLQPGEQIVNMAYILKAPSILMQIVWTLICFWVYFFQIKHFYAALTNQRLILIKTSGGFFRPKIANDGIEEYPLANVGNISTGGILNNKSIAVAMKDGSNLSLRIAPWAKTNEGQGKFIEDLQSTTRALTAGG